VNYREALGWLYATQRFGIKLGLENTERLLVALSVVEGRAPRDRSLMSMCDGEATASQSSALQLESRSSGGIHVAGTNGKGSVCAMIDAIARAAGHRTGLFTSPHLVSFRERIRVNGEKISEEEVARGLCEIRERIRDWDPHPTFFEITTALAWQHFQKARCEILVLETGMGGRLDATNAVQSSVSVITPIDFDHEKWLGHSIGEIAKEKAGIIKRRIPVVSAPQRPEAEVIIRQRAE
jgi:dihydrofolate synthase/folylpolyglutamate synthase